MTLEVVIYWIVVIFFALPIALGALLYVWRTFADIFRAPRRQREEEEDERFREEYWKEPEKRQED